MKEKFDVKCKFKHSKVGSAQWGIIFLLCFLSMATFLQLILLNYVSIKVYRKRVKKRAEARVLMMFCVLGVADILIGSLVTLRDMFYVFGECYDSGAKVLQTRKGLRMVENYFLTFRSALLCLMQVYYLLVYLRPYQSEFIASRVVAFTITLGLGSIASVILDEVMVSTEKCTYTNRWYETDQSIYASSYVMVGINTLSVIFCLSVYFVSLTGKGQGEKSKRRSRMPPGIITGLALNIISVGVLTFFLSLEGTERYDMIQSMNPTDQVIYTMSIHTGLKLCLISLFFVYIITLKYFWYEALSVMPSYHKK